MPANIPHRIDTAQHAVPSSMGSMRLRGRKVANASVGIGSNDSTQQIQRVQNSESTQTFVPGECVGGPPLERSFDPEKTRLDLADQDDWLRAHAADLIGHLQSWSMSLDQREASLNARIAMHDHRERQFRIQRSELAEQLASGQARVDQLRKQLEARARRLSFENHA